MMVIGDDGDVTLEDAYDDILMELEQAEAAHNNEINLGDSNPFFNYKKRGLKHWRLQPLFYL